MRRFSNMLGTICVLALWLAPVVSVFAEITAEQRSQLSDLRREVAGVPQLIRQDKYDEADEILSNAQSKVESIAEEAGEELSNRAFQGVITLIERHRATLERTRPRSFVSDVAPIIADNCLRCHGANNPRARLRLDTFAGWKRGGQSGPLLVTGRSRNSLLMLRLTASNAQRRMPQNGQALEQGELAAIAAWIDQGAKFDGDGEDTALADLASGSTARDDPSVIIPEPDGDETVSFTKDIAPWMANLCVNCHSGNNPRGGLSLVSFYDMMRGGDSGRVVLPGNRDGSRLWQLTGLQDPIKMPQGQALLTRKNWNDLRTWFDEGSVFDGEDARTPLRQYVMTTEEMEADRFAQMSTEEFEAFRRERSESQMKRAVPNDSFRTLESDDFLLIGNASAEKLRQVDQWAQEFVGRLRKNFSAGDGRLWKGRLAVFVMKDRFSYDEFNLVINRREAPREMIGHSVVTPTYEDAYVVLLDVGDEPSEDSPGLQVNLIDQLTGAFLKRDGAQLPDWVIRGTGLALAAQVSPNNQYLRQQGLVAKDAVSGIRQPQDVFSDGQFSPGTIGAVGYTLVDFMLDAGGSAKFGQFIAQLRSGQDTAAAMRQVYQSDLNAVARSYLQRL